MKCLGEQSLGGQSGHLHRASLLPTPYLPLLSQGLLGFGKSALGNKVNVYMKGW